MSANRVTHKHAHPLAAESGYPKSALKISSRASRAARSRHVGYIFFFPLPCPPPPATIRRYTLTPQWSILFFFFFEQRGRDRYRESGIKRMMVTKREKSQPDGRLCSRSWNRRVRAHSRKCDSLYRHWSDGEGAEGTHSNVTKGWNFVNFFSRRAAHRGGN